MDRLSRRERDRLVNACLYFSHHTEFCGVAKLFRLLYLLDVQHFQQTGISVTGERYQAWNFGPGPECLFESLDRSDSPVRVLFLLTSDASIDFYGFRLQPRSPYSLDHFTQRQIDLMDAVCQLHRGAHYGDIDIGIDNDAYLHTWGHGRGRGSLIPFERTIAPENPMRELVFERHREELLKKAAMQSMFAPRGHAA